jgi:hypothetical protein
MEEAHLALFHSLFPCSLFLCSLFLFVRKQRGAECPSMPRLCVSPAGYRSRTVASSGPAGNSSVSIMAT